MAEQRKLDMLRYHSSFSTYVRLPIFHQVKVAIDISLSFAGVDFRQAIFASPYKDWEAPTGGYLLTACLASGRVAAEGVCRWLV